MTLFIDKGASTFTIIASVLVLAHDIRFAIPEPGKIRLKNLWQGAY